MKNGAELISEERKRQIEVEGWDEKHDSEHLDYDLSSVGALYALNLVITKHKTHTELFNKMFSYFYPWANKWWKPTPNDPIRQLVKAGALIAAEIDRLQRQAIKNCDHDYQYEQKPNDTLNLMRVVCSKCGDIQNRPFTIKL